MRGYLIHFLVATLLMAGTMTGFNRWADPYAIYRDREAMLRQPQPIRIMNERVFKTVGLAHAKANVVLLGTSVTDIGIGRDQAAFAGKRVLNLATFGQPIRESLRLMSIAVEESKPQVIVLGLDLLAFNALMAPPSDYVEENYKPFRPYSLMLSISTLADSWKVLRHKAPAEGDCCYADGFRTAQNPALLPGTYRNNFNSNERVYLLEKYLPYPECSFSFARKDSGTSMDDLREMVRLAHQHHVDLRLFLSPSHARQWETVATAGLWDAWEAWKRQLVQINNDEAAQLGATPFPLWDFSNYDTFSSEDVPGWGDSKRVMRWYSDSAHFTPDLGKRIIHRMFGLPTGEQPENWGVMLNADNIETRLKQIRMAREHYRQSHPQDVAEIENTAREVNRVKHCPSR